MFTYTYSYTHSFWYSTFTFIYE